MSQTQTQTQIPNPNQTQIVVYGPYRVLGFNERALTVYAVYGILVVENDEIVCKHEKYVPEHLTYIYHHYCEGCDVDGYNCRWCGREWYARSVEEIKKIFDDVMEQAKKELDKDLEALRMQYGDAAIEYRDSDEVYAKDLFNEICEVIGHTCADEEGCHVDYKLCRESAEYLNDEEFENVIEFTKQYKVALYYDDPWSDPTITLPEPFEKCAPRCLDNP